MSTSAFKSLQDWLSWQETLHPSEIDLGLERVRQVLGRLLPQCFQQPDANLPFTVVTIAGTNGKGSTAALLEAILCEAGYQVGCYTSPHLLHYNERIRINKTPVSDSVICEAFARIERVRKPISLTYFEFGTLAAIDIFYQQQCEIVILEVGLGGRLDAVNVIDADIALITTVDIDHQDWLGSDRNAIGLEKAGIYRRNKPALYGDDNLPQSIADKVIREQLEFYQFSRDYEVNQRGGQWDWLPAKHDSQFAARYNLPLPGLQGNIQVKNAANVILILELLKHKFSVSQSEIKQGLLNTALAGRLQIITTEPLVIVDVAHNVQAVRVLRQSIEQLSIPGQLHAIVGMLKDKDVKAVISILTPIVDNWRVIDLDSPRAMPAREIAQLLLERSGNNQPGKNIQCFDSFTQAYQDYNRYNVDLGKGGILLVFGSFYTVSDALNTINKDASTSYGTISS